MVRNEVKPLDDDVCECPVEGHMLGCRRDPLTILARRLGLVTDPEVKDDNAAEGMSDDEPEKR